MPPDRQRARIHAGRQYEDVPIGEFGEWLHAGTTDYALASSKHSASSIPGREIVHVLTEIPAGVESGWHMHRGEEVGYIVAGTVRMEIEGQPTLTCTPATPS